MQAAVAAFAVTRKLPHSSGRRRWRRLPAELSGRAEEFAQCISAEAGKPIRTARGEVERAAFCFQYAAEETTRLHGEVLPLDAQAAGANRLGLLRRVPLGPVAAITPFNFPLNLVAHKLAPAMAAGCSIVLKPATKTPMVALMLADVVGALGVSAGGRQHSSHEHSDRGAADRGRALQTAHLYGLFGGGLGAEGACRKKESCAGTGRQRGLHRALGRRAGQGSGAMRDRRLCLRRAKLHQRAADSGGAQRLCEAFAGKLRRRRSSCAVGDPFDERTDVGPMIQLADAERAEQWIAEALGEGAKVLCGGTRSGSVLAPTVLTGTTEKQRVNCEEILRRW